jgi:hypothetical protein
MVKETWHIYTIEFFSAKKKNYEVSRRWMDQENFMLRKCQSQSISIAHLLLYRESSKKCNKKVRGNLLGIQNEKRGR